jgi:hypothetical protein
MGAAGALLLPLMGCGTGSSFEMANGAAAPDNLRTAYFETARARFALVACRAAEQRQAIGGLDGARSGAELDVARRFVGLDLGALKREVEQEMLVAQVLECAGDEGIARYRAAVGRLQKIGSGRN